MNNIAFVLCALVILTACKNQTKKKINKVEVAYAVLKDVEAPNDWIYLFDGTSTKGWRAYNGDVLPSQWLIKNGALTLNAEKKVDGEKKGSNDIIYAAEEFDNFELYLEWKITEGGNSGVFYHLKEGYNSPSEVGPEYQLLDDVKWETINNTKLKEWQKTGSDYAMHVADSEKKIIKPPEEWNTTRIIFTQNKVEHWLNGKKILSFVPWSSNWYRKKDNGKWKDFPDYGKYKKGYIGLQNYDSPLWFKNIRIKKL